MISSEKMEEGFAVQTHNIGNLLQGEFRHVLKNTFFFFNKSQNISSVKFTD